MNPSIDDDPYELKEEGPTDTAPSDTAPSLHHTQLIMLFLAVLLSGWVNFHSIWLTDQVAEYFAISYSVGGILLGFFIAQFAAVWLLIQAYIASRFARVLLSLVMCSLLIASVSASQSAIPLEFFFQFGMVVLISYFVFGLALGLLLRNTRCGWRPLSRPANNQFSIRTLIGSMVAFAVLAMLFKYFAMYSNSFWSMSFLDLFRFLFAAGYFLWILVAIAISVWLQLGTFRASNRFRYGVGFLCVSSIGPLVCLLVCGWIVDGPLFLQTFLEPEGILLAYLTDIGIALGIAMVIPILPRHQ
jgi:hypothetical protein